MNVQVAPQEPLAAPEATLARPVAAGEAGRNASSSGLRLLAKLAFHLLQNASVLIAVGIFWHLRQWRFLVGCLAGLFLSGAFLSWVAHSRREELLPVRLAPPCLQTPVVVVAYGLLQGLHLKHFFDVYAGRAELNAGVLDGIITGPPFAFFGLFSFYLLDSSGIECPWFMPEVSHGRGWIRWVLLLASCVSICHMASRILDVDYRVSHTVRVYVNGSLTRTAVYALYRGSEVACNVCLTAVGCFFLRPRMEALCGASSVCHSLVPYTLCVPSLGAWALYVSVILCLRPRGSPRESALAAMVVAYTMLVVNPAHFVEEPGFVGAARRLNRVHVVLRLLGVATVGVFVAAEWTARFPGSCHLERHGEIPREVGAYFLERDWVLLAILGLAFLTHCFIVLTVEWVRCGIAPGLDSAMLRLELVDGQQGQAAATLQVHHGARRGLSSYLVLSWGITTRLFDDGDDAPYQLSIERVLGMGAFGVVVLLRRTADLQAHLGLPGLSAMKLQNTQNAQRRELVRREGEIHEYLNLYPHRYINRSLAQFPVRMDREWATAGGSPVTDHDGRSQFNEAILLEYVDPGPDGIFANLEAFVLHKALDEGGAPPPGRAEALDWVRTSKRLAEESAEALHFLHGHNIIYRDFKPSNVLMKAGEDGERHICLTDFGYSKMPAPGDPLESMAGSLDYAAPEVPRYPLPGAPLAPYSKAVDVYSFGVTLHVIIRRTKRRSRGAWGLVVPPEHRRPDLGEMSNFPLQAGALIASATSWDPSQRPTFEQVMDHSFLRGFTHLGEVV